METETESVGFEEMSRVLECRLGLPYGDLRELPVRRKADLSCRGGYR